MQSLLSVQLQWQPARDVLAAAGCFGVAQGTPGVVESSPDRAGKGFAQCQATGECAGQGAAGTVIAAGQAFAEEFMATAVARVQTVDHLGLLAVAAGDQQ